MSEINSKRNLDKEAWILIMMSGLFAIATALSSSFVGVYLWKVEKGFALIAWFYFYSYLGTLSATLYAGWLIKRVDRVIGIRLGVVILSIFYVLMLLLDTTSMTYVYVLGAILGIGNGFFWLAFSVLYFEITHRENRDKFNGINGLSASLAGIINPLLAGFVITQVDHDDLGYRIIFTISLILFMIAVLLSFAIQARSSKKNYRVNQVLSQLVSRKQKWFWIHTAMFIQGIREGVLFFLLGLLIYAYTNNEMTLSWFLTTSSFVALLAHVLISRYITLQQRSFGILWGTTMLGIVTVPFILQQNIGTLLLFGIGSAFFLPFYYGPLNTTIFDVVGEKDEHVELRVEYIALKDIMLNIGRMFSVLTFIWWIRDSESILHMRWFILFVGFIQIPICYCMHKMNRLK